MVVTRISLLKAPLTATVFGVLLTTSSVPTKSGGSPPIVQAVAVDGDDYGHQGDDIQYAEEGTENVRRRVRVLASDDCPAIDGMTLLCSDNSGLGNCYQKKYECTVSGEGQCGCSKVK